MSIMNVSQVNNTLTKPTLSERGKQMEYPTYEKLADLIHTLNRADRETAQTFTDRRKHYFSRSRIARRIKGRRQAWNRCFNADSGPCYLNPESLLISIANA